MSKVDYATVPEPETEAEVWAYFERSQQAKKAAATRAGKARIRAELAAGIRAPYSRDLGGGVILSPQAPEHVSDIREARKAWDDSRAREATARALLVAVLREARAEGMTLEAIAGELGTTRQYVWKLLKD